MNWRLLLIQLQQASTWRGLGWFLTAVVGVSFADGSWDYIANIGMGIVGLIGIFTTDCKLFSISKEEPSKEVPPKESSE